MLYLTLGNQAKFSSGQPPNILLSHIHAYTYWGQQRRLCQDSMHQADAVFAPEGPAVHLSSLELVVTLWPFKPCGSKLCLTADKQCLAGIHRHPFLGDAEPFTHLEQYLHLCPSRASLILTDIARPPLQTLLPGHAPSAQVHFNRVWMCCERARIATTKLVTRVHSSIGPGFYCVCIISGGTGHVSWCELIVAKEKLHSSCMHNSEPLDKPSFNHHQSNAPS